MKKIIVLFLLLIAFSCEDKKDEISSLIGTWEVSNLGEYENANCSGALDYTGWAFAQAFGFKVTIVIKEDGTGTMTMTFGDEKEETPLTWDESKSQICLMGVECLTYKVNDNKFTIDTQDEALCVDDNDEETSHTDQSSCEAAGNNWEEAVCTQMEFTKE
tara:strand:+ start:126 stop:605 length:480 start_codon:yes stop_codon:yes gene_type:complete